MKRIFFTFFCCVFLLLSLNRSVSASTPAPEVTAEGAVLMDGVTGKLIYEKNPDKRLSPASTTKIMTTVIVLENCNLNDKVTVGKNPPNTDGSAVGIKTDEVFTVKDLLGGMLLESGNDCAEALAEHVAGSISDFAKLMNAKALELGCTNTNFVNPSGLYDENHYTTARDLALIMREAIKNPAFLEIEKLPFYQLPPSNLDPNPKWSNNKNQLMLKNSHYYYPYAIAGKTGYTIKARHSYTAAALKDNQILISAMINGEGKEFFFPETKNLLEYGFANFQVLKLYSKGQEVIDLTLDKNKIPLLASEDFYALIKKDESNLNVSSAVCKLEAKDLSKTSFGKGERLIDSKIYLKDNLIGSLTLMSGASYEVPPVKSASNYIKNTIPLWAVITGTLVIISLFLWFLIRKAIRK
ncbi:D-alanyl-D-alanine carboxypeptidase [Clostridium amylolyticum]|uniref:serine-type D-Ala-D-Ala carboxypeptidase n=1 Tax=Clostridium amylolyticum TaxID=1121298 RepID=A0A1M6BGK5_9CLOT|nr:D-alanyl-D-alanine carboxypeptidase family protein [Clostridium amylolyticum]SHI47816.1 D-alanyl-D-alanine carboxypeptidase [Clostridium amylolyticum]